AAAEVLDHQQPHGAHGQADPDEPRVGVRQERAVAQVAVVAGQEDADDPQGESDDAHQQGGDLQLAERGMDLVRLGHWCSVVTGCVVLAVFSRIASAMSDGAFWLSWSARMYMTI